MDFLEWSPAAIRHAYLFTFSAFMAIVAFKLITVGLGGGLLSSAHDGPPEPERLVALVATVVTASTLIAQPLSASVTAALYLRATGDASKEATITHATATVTQRKEPQQARKLTWLWSGDFIPGQKFERKQVTVNSIKGGESRSQEMWFLPLEEACGAGTFAECDVKSRVNFLPWQKFYASLMNVPSSSAVQDAAIDVAFEFHYREGTERKSKRIACVVEVSPTVKRMATPEENRGVLAVTVPCRLSPPAAGQVALVGAQVRG